MKKKILAFFMLFIYIFNIGIANANEIIVNLGIYNNNDIINTTYTKSFFEYYFEKEYENISKNNESGVVFNDDINSTDDFNFSLKKESGNNITINNIQYSMIGFHQCNKEDFTTNGIRRINFLNGAYETFNPNINIGDNINYATVEASNILNKFICIKIEYTKDNIAKTDFLIGKNTITYRDYKFYTYDLENIKTGTHSLKLENNSIDHFLIEEKDLIDSYSIKWYKNGEIVGNSENYTFIIPKEKGTHYMYKEVNGNMSGRTNSYITRGSEIVIVHIVDKENLRNKLNESTNILNTNGNKDKYTTDSWTNLQNNHNNATNILNNGDSKQEDIDNATTNLTNAINNLNKKPVDKTALINKINQANQIDKNNYTSDSVNNLNTALNNANIVNNNPNATQEQVNNATTNLNNAINNLNKKPVDKTALVNKINEANQIDKNNYTSDSVNNLNTALNNANIVNNNPNATQEEVNNATTNLTNAINNLKLKNTYLGSSNNKDLLDLKDDNRVQIKGENNNINSENNSNNSNNSENENSSNNNDNPLNDLLSKLETKENEEEINLNSAYERIEIAPIKVENISETESKNDNNDFYYQKIKITQLPRTGNILYFIIILASILGTYFIFRKKVS